MFRQMAFLHSNHLVVDRNADDGRFTLSGDGLAGLSVARYELKSRNEIGMGRFNVLDSLWSAQCKKKLDLWKGAPS